MARSIHHSRDAIGAIGLVVGNHQRSGFQPPAAQRACKGFRRWQRVPPGCRGAWPGQLFVQVCVDGAGNVAGKVVRAAAGGIGKFKPAVHDQQAGAGDPARQCSDADQRRGARGKGRCCHPRIIAAVTAAHKSSLQFPMAIDLYWSSGSPFSWRVLLALELKGLSYNSHLLHLDLQEQKAPQMLAMNPRGRAAGAARRRLRGVRVGGSALLPGPQVSGPAHLRQVGGRGRRDPAGDRRIPDVHRSRADAHTVFAAWRFAARRLANGSRMPCTSWPARREPSRAGCPRATG